MVLFISLDGTNVNSYFKDGVTRDGRAAANGRQAVPSILYGFHGTSSRGTRDAHLPVPVHIRFYYMQIPP
ncbi:hypothetical protein CLOSTASPAR_06239 [[Clostridium] asparagiforme DSM 15981]|uniref:Uncharacterized protein n=1 Tax=[Clostridium] asparagiforme DSM 15981 TaxID=518636 RepID=C0DAD6_9FIRM|nr:hypothetical protein CLOSTASPAR_06239 [[Clostridium] asparagiforme DSM 15981]